MQIARLDEDGKLIGVEDCSEADYRTDPASRTVRLEPGHDMRFRIGNYRFDYNRGSFSALSNEPFEQADRDTPELVEGVIEAIEDIFEYLNAMENAPFKLRASGRTKRTFANLRRRIPRKDRRVRLDDDLPAGPQFLTFGASFLVRPPQ